MPCLFGHPHTTTLGETSLHKILCPSCKISLLCMLLTVAHTERQGSGHINFKICNEVASEIDVTAGRVVASGDASGGNDPPPPPAAATLR